MNTKTATSSNLKVGEIIKAKSKLGLIPEGLYRVDGSIFGHVMLSVGEIRMGAPSMDLEILERDLSQPETWLPEEIKVIKHQLTYCNCAKCRKSLAQKERLLDEANASAQVVH